MKKRYPYYPIYIDIEDREVLIVGGGNVCARKAETMMKYGARVTIVSPAFTEEIEGGPRGGLPSSRPATAGGTGRWRGAAGHRLPRKPYEEADLEGATMVIASTD